MLKTLIPRGLVFLALTLCTGLGTPVWSRATNSLPPIIAGKLDRLYPGWKFQQIANDERQYCVAKDSPFLAQTSLVWGDFDGDGQKDYATLIRHGGKTIAIVFLKRGGDYQAFPIFTTDTTEERSPDILAVTHKGEKYLDHESGRAGVYSGDTVIVAYCESSAVAYIYSAGTFRRVVVSD